MNGAPRSVGSTLALAALTVIVVWALYVARDALVIIYISMLLAVGFSPLVRAIEHQRFVPVGTKRLPRWLAILIVYVTIVGCLVLLALLVIPPIVEQVVDLWARLPGWFDHAQDWFVKHGLQSHKVTFEEAVRHAPGSPETAVGTVATALTHVVGTALAFVTVFILTFYFLIESSSLFAGFARLFPRERRPRVEELARQITSKVSAWLTGQLILAGTIAITASTGLYLLGVPYFYVIGLIAAVGEMIPIIGPFLSAIPAVGAAFAVSPRTALFVLIFWIVQQQLESHVLVPKLMQHQLGISPVVIIGALLIGAAVFGMPGALLAVPTAAIIQVVVQEILDERDLPERRRTTRVQGF